MEEQVPSHGELVKQYEARRKTIQKEMLVTGSLLLTVLLLCLAIEMRQWGLV
jgi:hypothetical protein